MLLELIQSACRPAHLTLLHLPGLLDLLCQAYMACAWLVGHAGRLVPTCLVAWARERRARRCPAVLRFRPWLPCPPATVSSLLQGMFPEDLNLKDP